VNSNNDYTHSIFDNIGYDCRLNVLKYNELIDISMVIYNYINGYNDGNFDKNSNIIFGEYNNEYKELKSVFINELIELSIFKINKLKKYNNLDILFIKLGNIGMIFDKLPYLLINFEFNFH